MCTVLYVHTRWLGQTRKLMPGLWRHSLITSWLLLRVLGLKESTSCLLIIYDVVLNGILPSERLAATTSDYTRCLSTESNHPLNQFLDFTQSIPLRASQEKWLQRISRELYCVKLTKSIYGLKEISAGMVRLPHNWGSVRHVICCQTFTMATGGYIWVFIQTATADEVKSAKYAVRG